MSDVIHHDDAVGLGKMRDLVVPDAMVVASVVQEDEGFTGARGFVPNFAAVIVDRAL